MEVEDRPWSRRTDRTDPTNGVIPTAPSTRIPTRPRGRDGSCADADVVTALRAAIDRLPPRLRLIAGYHLGWWDQHGEGCSGGAGKVLRSALLLAVCRALGGDVAAARAPAVAIELVHNFTMLHDDVMDRDTVRRHRPTAWTVYGIDDAILAGDALQSLATSTVLVDAHPASADAALRMANTVVEMCAGQVDDCAFARRLDVTPSECLTMTERKIGALLGCAAAIGGRYAGAPPLAVAALDRFGRELGLAFQLIDDLLGISGDPRVTGKPAGADLIVRKKSLPVVAALDSGTVASAELRDLLDTDRDLRADEVERATELVERGGGRAWARAGADAHIERARAGLAAAAPATADLRELHDLADLITRRNW
ncbi:polyprenyl synthetase family protein [Pseudonocardia sp. TRM90224]|uniref:polyprenyl synthetase family protein n=1 Tax=Pseudonocardia sp. TRM90224 TaxID=2812678 RepID=UPI001E5AEEA2|nr:polyprenyl synthetase family protein [Pseudonocardia sp. TRM90224]